MITFAQPFWILLGAIGVFLYWLLSHRIDVWKKKQLESFASSSLLKELTPSISETRRRIKKTVLMLAIFCCFIALARPQYGYRWIDVKHKGIDILFALDTSKSMLAEDILPNRLERSKLAVMDFVSQLEGDRVGLLPFAGASYLVCPLTSDYHAFEQSLMAIDTSIIPAGGTDIGNALNSAAIILNNEANHKILILITDGEDLEGDAKKAAIQAQEQNLTVYTVGIGTTAGELIPNKEKGGFVKDKKGNYIKSKLDEKSLKTIADLTDAIYVPLGNKGQGLETIYQQKLALIPKTEFAEKRKKVPVERFNWPLSAALILISLEYLISGRRPDQTLPKVFSRLTKRNRRDTKVLIPLLLFFALANTQAARASAGEDAYNSGNFIEAAEYYQKLLEKDPENPKLLYNSGAMAYKNNLMDEAVSAFRKSLASDDIELQKKSYYNLGNALYRKGEQSQQADPKKTIDAWEQSLESYKGALALDKDNKDAQFNHDLVNKKLEQLRQQQESQQQQNSDSEEQQDNKENGKKDGNDQNKDKTEENREEQSQSEDGTKPEDEAPQDATTPEEEQDTGQANPEPTGQNNETAEPNTPSPAQSAEDTMTREEAEKLLQAVQDEEGRLNLYVPMQQKNNSGKDW